MPRRVAALLAPPPRRQLALLAIVAILILTAGASAAEAARDLHALLEFAQAARYAWSPTVKVPFPTRGRTVA